MKKVININFQGRILPIEELAYENLKNYIDTLRTYFDKEEGKDEIINDITFLKNIFYRFNSWKTRLYT